MKRLLWALLIAMGVSVAGTPAVEAQKPTLGQRVDDAKITAEVKTKLAADRAKNLVSVNVDTSQGVVHLQGTVSTDQDRLEAERLARGTDGVRHVQNDLLVTSGAASPKTR